MPTQKGREGMKSCMEEFKAGTLHSGHNGPVVSKRGQAIAICLRTSGTGKPAWTPPKGKK
jgi:hypothetical protein